MTLRRCVGLIVLSAALTACASNNSPAAPTSPATTDTSVSEVANVRGIENDLEGQIDQKPGVVGSRVECPRRVDWKVSDSFRCDVAAPGYPPGSAEVTLEHEGGKYSWYLSNTCPDEGSNEAPRPGCVTPVPGYSDLPTPTKDQ